MVKQICRVRKPTESPRWQCLCAHFCDFSQAYPEKYGFLKPVVEDVDNKYIDCGDRTKDFARIYCEKSMLLPFSFASPKSSQGSHSPYF